MDQRERTASVLWCEFEISNPTDLSMDHPRGPRLEVSSEVVQRFQTEAFASYFGPGELQTLTSGSSSQGSVTESAGIDSEAEGTESRENCTKGIRWAIGIEAVFALAVYGIRQMWLMVR
jgi:hypothetical protein